MSRAVFMPEAVNQPADLTIGPLTDVEIARFMRGEAPQGPVVDYVNYCGIHIDPEVAALMDDISNRLGTVSGSARVEAAPVNTSAGLSLGEQLAAVKEDILGEMNLNATMKAGLGVRSGDNSNAEELDDPARYNAALAPDPMVETPPAGRSSEVKGHRRARPSIKQVLSTGTVALGNILFAPRSKFGHQGRHFATA